MIQDIIQNVKSKIIGRFADGGKVAAHLLQLVKKAGDGNYLEIGVLHGGSICAVALFKKELGQKGICVGVDMFNGYYNNPDSLKDKKSEVEVTLKTALSNIEQFKLDNVKLIQAKSPDFNVDLKFSVSYIDANHSYAGVLADWRKVKDITTRFVLFHDYAVIPDVKKACDFIARKSTDWRLYYKGNYIFILERIT